MLSEILRIRSGIFGDFGNFGTFGNFGNVGNLGFLGNPYEITMPFLDFMCAIQKRILQNYCLSV